MNKAKQDLINAAILLALCGFAYFETLVIPPPVLGKTGAAFFPKIVITILAILCFGLLVSGIYRIRKQSNSSTERKMPTSLSYWIKNNKKVLYTFIIFAFYVVLLNLIGYITSTMLFLFGMYFLLARKKSRLIFVSLGIVAVTFMVYFIFQDVLKIFLPGGIWF